MVSFIHLIIAILTDIESIGQEKLILELNLLYGLLQIKFILVDNMFEPQLVKCTVQPDVKSKDITVHDKKVSFFSIAFLPRNYDKSKRYCQMKIKVRLRIWDTAGSERFRAINRSFFRNALGVITVYDVTDRASFKKVSSWLEEIEVNCDKPPVIILVGNKTDLADQRQGKS